MHNFTVCGTIFAATAADVIATVGFGTARSLASFAKYAFGTSIFGQQAFYDTLVAPVPRIVRMRSTFHGKEIHLPELCRSAHVAAAILAPGKLLVL